MRQLDAEYRLDKNIKIAMLYLEDDDAVSAEAFIKKASALIGSCKVSAGGRAAYRHPSAHHHAQAAVCECVHGVDAPLVAAAAGDDIAVTTAACTVGCAQADLLRKCCPLWWCVPGGDADAIEMPSLSAVSDHREDREYQPSIRSFYNL